MLASTDVILERTLGTNGKALAGYLATRALPDPCVRLMLSSRERTRKAVVAVVATAQAYPPAAQLTARIWPQGSDKPPTCG